MKSIFTFVLTALLTVCICAALPLSGEEEIYTGVVRLHVEAASDSAKDQNLKILVRDAVLSAYGEEMMGVKDVKEASALLQGKLPEMEETVRACLREAGEEGEVKLSFGEEYYETRRYGDITLPAGRYTSLRITLGKGEGQNWWCVLYPALCTEAALGKTVPKEEVFSEAEYRLVKGGEYALKFRTLEILESLFGNP